MTAISVLGGCSRSSGSANPAASGTGPGAPLDEVRIGYFANLTHAQGVLGVASGDFERAVSPAKITGRITHDDYTVEKVSTGTSSRKR